MSELTSPYFDPSKLGFELVAARMEEERRARRLARRPANALHVRPHLDYYREQASLLHKSQLAQDPAATLHSAQFEVARSVGYPSWPKLAAAIHNRKYAADQLSNALGRGDTGAIVRIVRKHAHALLDAGCIASPEELGLMLKIVPGLRRDSKLRTALLDAVAEHHRPEGLDECVRVLTDWGEVEPFYADDIIKDRWRRAEESPNGAQAAKSFEDAIGVLCWLTDPPDYSEYMSEGD